MEMIMVIFTALIHPNGFFINADQQGDFWVLFSKSVGWGRFTMIRPSHEFTADGGLFELCEMRPADATCPYPVVQASDVLWRRREAIEAELSISSYHLDSLWKN